MAVDPKKGIAGLREADEAEPGWPAAREALAGFFCSNFAPKFDPLQSHSRQHVTPAAKH